jgi:hypothetical protein
MMGLRGFLIGLLDALLLRRPVLFDVACHLETGHKVGIAGYPAHRYRSGALLLIGSRECGPFLLQRRLVSALGVHALLKRDLGIASLHGISALIGNAMTHGSYVQLGHVGRPSC